MKEMMIVAFSCLGIDYQWGGKNPLTGLDCSGLVEWCLMSIGFDPPGIVNAQGLHDWLIQGHSNGNSIGAGSICFYGKSATEISHVALMINPHQIIEAGGGDHTTTSVQVAEKQGACVRIRTFDHRKDLICIINPQYPDWVING